MIQHVGLLIDRNDYLDCLGLGSWDYCFQQWVSVLPIGYELSAE
jgi:hypothetical protein